MEYKTNVEPHEWYSWKRAHPREYKVIEEYIFQRFTFVTIDYKGQTVTNLLIPRLFFTWAEMLRFLARFRHLREYQHIRYTERTCFEGKKYLAYDFDDDAVAWEKRCDYVWLEVRRLLSAHKNLLRLEEAKKVKKEE